MTTMRDDFDALMPEPAGFRTRYRSEPEMIGYYPWTYADAGRRRRRYDRPECEYEDLYTAEQLREAIRTATELATELAAEEATALATDAAIKYANGHPVDFSKEVGDAIRGKE